MSSHILRNLVSVSILSLATLPAAAEWRCDCTQTVANCNATVTLEGNGITVRSDRKECSRVDYIVEGQPFVTVAVDGQGQEAWLPQTSTPQIVVRSCNVCRDNLAGAAMPVQDETAADETGSSAAEDKGGPVVRFDPIYPQNARQRGIEGYVNLDVKINADGTVRSASVVEANPPRVFDQAAVATVNRWRYAPAAEADRARRETVVFRLPRSYRGGESAAGRPGFRDFNHCVRVAHDGGALMGDEVLLENVCDDVLVVHVCSEGGHGRLTCGPWGGEGVLLVRSGDERAGSRMSVYRDLARQSFIYTERVSVPLPGNARYWWLACESRDAACNDAGQRWRGLYDGRPTSVNPGDSSFVKVARSL